MDNVPYIICNSLQVNVRVRVWFDFYLHALVWLSIFKECTSFLFAFCIFSLKKLNNLWSILVKFDIKVVTIALVLSFYIFSKVRCLNHANMEYARKYPAHGNLDPDKTLHKKIKFSIRYFFSKCGQISRILRIWLHLLKKSFMENFIFCAVKHHYMLKKSMKMNLLRK